jgi:thiosulfate reductase/polysulfide reductase chain A
MAIFQALGGGIDTKGGLVFGSKLPLGEHKGVVPMYYQARERAVNKNKQNDGYDHCVVVSGGGSWIAWRNRFLENVMPYKVRGAFIYKHNPMQNMPNTAKTAEMLKKMELVVAIDTMPSDTVMYADVVLPECTYLERTDPVFSFGGVEPAIAQRNKVIEPMYETKPVNEILHGLTKKISKPLFEITKKHDMFLQDEITASESDLDENSTMTLAELSKQKEETMYADEFDLKKVFEHSQEEVNEHMVASKHGEEAVKKLKEHGIFYPNMDIYYKQLGENEFQYYPEKEKSYSVNGGAPKTPTKKIECNLANLASKGVDPMPTWRDEYSFKVPSGKFKLLTGRHAQFTQTGTSNNIALHDLMHTNYIWINEKVAREQGIAFGDKVEVSSASGKTIIRAYPTEKIAPDTVFFVHGFGEESEKLTMAYKNGGCDNAVIEDNIEPVYGAAAMHETNVEIRKV